MVLEHQGGEFELGFFTPTHTWKRYVGIWYHMVTPRTVVWVANRDKPLTANSIGVLTIEDDNLRVLDDVTGKHYWSTDIGTSSSSNMIVKIMDSENLVLRDTGELTAGPLWQSFQNPTDTFIPGMLMDSNLELTSWSDEGDPGTGNFTFKLDQESQFIILNNSMPYWKTGGPGFKPQSVDKWTLGDFSDGCTRDSSICGHEDTFLSLKMMKVGNPDTEIVVYDEIECKNICLSSCECQAYSYAAHESIARRDYPKTSLCRVWTTDLNNLVEVYDNSHDIAARVALSDMEVLMFSRWVGSYRWNQPAVIQKPAGIGHILLAIQEEMDRKDAFAIQIFNGVP